MYKNGNRFLRGFSGRLINVMIMNMVNGGVAMVERLWIQWIHDVRTRDCSVEERVVIAYVPVGKVLKGLRDVTAKPVHGLLTHEPHAKFWVFLFLESFRNTNAPRLLDDTIRDHFCRRTIHIYSNGRIWPFFSAVYSKTFRLHYFP